MHLNRVFDRSAAVVVEKDATLTKSCRAWIRIGILGPLVLRGFFFKRYPLATVTRQDQDVHAFGRGKSLANVEDDTRQDLLQCKDCCNGIVVMTTVALL